MQGTKRRVTYVFFYEVFSFFICAMVLAVLSGTTISHTGPLSILIAVIAVTVNFFYNYVFELWEKSDWLSNCFGDDFDSAHCMVDADQFGESLLAGFQFDGSDSMLYLCL